MLYYIHGYQSSPSGQKATLLKETIQAIPITYRDGPPEDLIISKCLDRISKSIAGDQQAILIGSSLGGFLSAETALTHRNVQQLILLNPAIIPPETDLTAITGMPLRILQEMKDPRLFTEKIPANITILRGTLDEVVPDRWVHRFAQTQNATIKRFTDDHQFTNTLQNLPKIITEILKKYIDSFSVSTSRTDRQRTAEF
jgi:predicted esterase YcpF (UPF0227 family)